MVKIISVYTRMQDYGGAQKVLLSIHKGLKGIGYNSSISSFDCWNDIHASYKDSIDVSEYNKLTILFLLRLKKSKDVIILSHHRKVTSYLILLKSILRINISIIHVAHNEFHSLRRFTLFPRNIIAVSNAVKNNLITQFKVKKENIEVIYNGLEDCYKPSNKQNDLDQISIVYPARVNHVKQQIELVNRLKGKLPKNIKIIFVGDGPDYNQLNKIIKNSENFSALGFCSDMQSLYERADYTLLFSLHEGLPLSLIESIMHKTPAICNRVGGSMEIINDGINGFVCNTFDSLLDCLRKLSTIELKQYMLMSNNARKIYEINFDYKVMIEKYEGCIKKTIK